MNARAFGNTLVLDAHGRRPVASATWAMTNYEFAHVLPPAQNCSLSVYVAGPNVSGSRRAPFAGIDLNGERVASVPFGSNAGDFFFARDRQVPQGRKPSAVPMTPLFAPYGLVFPVASRFCNAAAWNVAVTLRNAAWHVDRVGIIARYTPARPAPSALGPAVVVAAILLTCALVLAIHALFEAVLRRYGVPALLLTLAVFVVGLLTHDEWDFRVWLRFVDLVAFGHGNPAHMWAGAPLWPFLTALLAPVLATTYALTGDGSQDVTALFLKLAMGLAAAGNALTLANHAPRRLGRFLFPLFLLSPLALYELAGGYRELFAGSFALAGFALAIRSRYVVSAVAFSLAACISESLVPLIFLPLSLRLSRRRDGARTPASAAAYAALDAAAGVVPIATLWLFFIPHSVASTVVATRISGAYRFGGASWFSTLSGFGVLPPWLGAHSLEVFFGLFLALAALPAFALARAVFSERDGQRRDRQIFGAFLAFVAAFFLSYRGIDPATLYALFVVAAFYFVRFDPANPYPLFLSGLAAFAYYAILGIGDFANWTYVMPRNESLIGILGAPMLVAVLAVQLTILALYASLIARDTSLLFGRGSVFFLLLFFGAAANVANEMYAIDIVFCSAVAMLLLLAFRRSSQLRAHRTPWQRTALVDCAGLATMVVVGACTSTHGGAAALAAFIALLLGLAYGFGLCDLVLGACSSLLLWSQPGFGWVSIAGWIVLSLLAVGAIGQAHRTRAGATRAVPLAVRR